jgi:hypothetical protein
MLHALGGNNWVNLTIGKGERERSARWRMRKIALRPRPSRELAYSFRFASEAAAVLAIRHVCCRRTPGLQAQRGNACFPPSSRRPRTAKADARSKSSDGLQPTGPGSIGSRKSPERRRFPQLRAATAVSRPSTTDGSVNLSDQGRERPPSRATLCSRGGLSPCAHRRSAEGSVGPSCC